MKVYRANSTFVSGQIVFYQMLPRMKRANSIDDLEMRPDVQEKVAKLWNEAVTENLSEISDLEGYDFTICLVLQ
jgi:trans-2-enoyl-CoA reductase